VETNLQLATQLPALLSLEREVERGIHNLELL
jgi:hypothetical protein